MKINYKNLSNFNPCVIAETACGHDGSLTKLKTLIKIAKESGVQTIKFQIYKLRERANPNSKEEKIFKKLLLSDTEWKKAVQFAHKKGLFVFADIFGDESLNLAEKIKVDAYKIHSEDTLNFSFITRVMKKNKIVMIGVGGSHRIEVKSLLDYLKRENLNNQLILMTGIQTFPTPMEAHSISEVSDLISKYSKYKVKVGFSDHAKGGSNESFLLPIMAISVGAVIIEKHFTTNRKFKQTDYHSSLNKEELKIFVNQIDKLKRVLKPISEFTKWERSYRNMFKKSPIITKRKLVGEVIEANEISYVKNTLSPQSLNLTQISNKKVKKNMNAGSSLSLKNIQQKVGIVIVVRTGSNRFPGKALGKIMGRESIACLIDRMKRVKNADEIILATSTDKSDDILVEIAKREGVNFFRGSLKNVALRYFEAAKKFQLDQIVRITGDAIVCDENMLEKAVNKQIEKGSDVVFMKNMPYGTAKEIFSFRAIKAIAEYAIEPNSTEYLEWFLENSRNFKIEYIKSPYRFDKKIRLTLDYKEDLIQLNRIFSGLKNKKDFNLSDILKFLKKRPDIVKINSHLRPKFKREQINTELTI